MAAGVGQAGEDGHWCSRKHRSWQKLPFECVARRGAPDSNQHDESLHSVVTELSYNYFETSEYVAKIEFITENDWRGELELLYQDLLDNSGSVSRDSYNADTDAGVAYAKIKAVYPSLTKEDMANISIPRLIQGVAKVLGQIRTIEENDSLLCYKQLQRYVDSKEKGEKKGEKKTKEAKEMEYWPLIKVVKLYSKAAALATGAVVVDLPGVHNANAARAAVAEGYIKSCTGLWIVAPIIRAVDDKSAKKLLGDTFKRQLKMDGNYNDVTFICNKTDDVSLSKVSDSLELDEENGPLWTQMDEYSNEQDLLKRELTNLQDEKAAFGQIMTDRNEEVETWEQLRDKVEDGETVYAPIKSQKRKSGSSFKSNKRQKRLDYDSEDDFIAPESNSSADELEGSDAEAEIEQPRAPLTEEDIKSRLTDIRDAKKQARQARQELDDKARDLKKRIAEAKSAKKAIEAKIVRACISGRNEYSKGAIQQDFAAGIKELDQEIAAEEDEENFDPGVDARDYDEVARSLPVFCISSRGYQKLRGRLRKDAHVSGFTDVEETEVPALQAHCKSLTIAGRTAACRRFLAHMSQFLNSFSI